MYSTTDFAFVNLTILSWSIPFLCRFHIYYKTAYHAVHTIFCLLISLATIPSLEHISPFASPLPLLVSLLLTVARFTSSLLVPRAELPSFVAFRFPSSSFPSRERLRFIIYGFRSICLLHWTLLFIANIDKDVYTAEYVDFFKMIQVSTGIAGDIVTGFADVDGDSYFPLTEFSIAFIWHTVYSDAAVTASRIEVLLSFPAIELSVSVLLYLASRYILQFRGERVNPELLPTFWASRFRHFIVPQVVIELVYRSHPQVYANRTLVCALIVGLIHVAFRSLSITHRSGWIAAVVLRMKAVKQIARVEPTYQFGIVDVSDLRLMGNLQEADFTPRLRRIESYVPTAGHKVGALSYKHRPPYERTVKISADDLEMAFAAFEKLGITHVWIDFVQNTRVGDGHHNHVEARVSNWFEKGVAPYIHFQVVKLWTEDEALDSMWLRIEEMAGLLGKGVYDARTDESLAGLGLSLEAAVLQLGARCSVGELAGCRMSYNEDIDHINRSFGEAVVAAVYDIPLLSKCRVPDGSDVVYRSQITVNIMYAIPRHMTTTWTDATEGLKFTIGRQWSSDGDESDALEYGLRLEEQHGGLRVFSKRQEVDEEGSGGGDRFWVVSEVTSAFGNVFRVVAEADGTEDGGMSTVRHKWIGENAFDMCGFEEVDRSKWTEWLA